MIITIIGWIVVVIVAALLLLWGYASVLDYRDEILNRQYYKNIDKFADRINGHKHWLNSPERLPYRELFNYIVEGMKKGYISGDGLREKVDEIIEKHKQQKKRQANRLAFSVNVQVYLFLVILITVLNRNSRLTKRHSGYFLR